MLVLSILKNIFSAYLNYTYINIYIYKLYIKINQLYYIYSYLKPFLGYIILHP